jgi:hypothetical protein
MFKILVQLCKIISHNSILFSDKMNHTKIYNNFKFYIRWIVKNNSKTQRGICFHFLKDKKSQYDGIIE